MESSLLLTPLPVPPPQAGEGALWQGSSSRKSCARVSVREIAPVPRSQPPARMQRHDAAGHALEAGPCEAGIAHHLRERLRMWEAADRFDQIAIGFAIARHHAPERRDHVE